MAGNKNFVNHSNKNLTVTLIVRNGADPSNGNAGEVKFPLPAGQTINKSYGDSSNIFLNGISFSWDDGGAQLTKTEMVTVRGSWWDDVMNTNSVLTWNGVGRASIAGSN